MLLRKIVFLTFVFSALVTANRSYAVVDNADHDHEQQVPSGQSLYPDDEPVVSKEAIKPGEKIEIEKQEPRALDAATLVSNKKQSDPYDDQHASYKKRRGSWGFLVSAAGSTYAPTEYNPDNAINESYDSYYGSGGVSTSVEFSLKKNTSIGSISLDAGVGMFSRGGKNNANLSIIPAHVGGTLWLDSFGEEPRIVPYAGGGTVAFNYKETQASKTVGGLSPFTYYYRAGIALQLNWFDEYANFESRNDSGLLNFFVFAEVLGYGSTVAVNSSDFANPAFFQGGVRMEF